MSATTIQIPAEQVEAIRRSLIAQRGHGERDAEIDDLLGQLARRAPGGTRPCALTGSLATLWGAVYDSLCEAAEQLAEDCNEYWRGAVAPDHARAGVADVSARLELLVGLGAPPGS